MNPAVECLIQLSLRRTLVLLFSMLLLFFATNSQIEQGKSVQMYSAIAGSPTSGIRKKFQLNRSILQYPL